MTLHIFIDLKMTKQFNINGNLFINLPESKHYQICVHVTLSIRVLPPIIFNNVTSLFPYNIMRILLLNGLINNVMKIKIKITSC